MSEMNEIISYVHNSSHACINPHKWTIFEILPLPQEDNSRTVKLIPGDYTMDR